MKKFWVYYLIIFNAFLTIASTPDPDCPCDAEIGVTIFTPEEYDACVAANPECDQTIPIKNANALIITGVIGFSYAFFLLYRKKPLIS